MIHRRKRRKRPPPPPPLIEIVETLQPAPADLDFGTPEEPTAWYLVWTTPRGEEKAADGLLQAGCQVFWPHMIRETRRRNKPVITNKVSTYARYLFVSGLPSLARRLTVVGEDGRSGITVDGLPITDIRQIAGVVGVVSDGRGWAKVPVGILRQLVVYQGKEPAPVSSIASSAPKLAPGESVVITGGPFMTFQATVVDRIGLDAARVLIDIFGGRTPAEIDVAHLRPL
ncbi:MAG: hypothetical protein DI527_18840 [Chelatococcus sp.]|nr:MAG: hypothetical protein DI527_18840 [Chelatococcus sp.]